MFTGRLEALWNAYSNSNKFLLEASKNIEKIYGILEELELEGTTKLCMAQCRKIINNKYEKCNHEILVTIEKISYISTLRKWKFLQKIICIMQLKYLLLIFVFTIVLANAEPQDAFKRDAEPIAESQDLYKRDADNHNHDERDVGRR
ncbi:hypothetical protein RhiirA4_464929 [Rhizophagus irregularis]|uniref:Uncharacterized protein n=1 Tax=Rhizophagus irregularis TaxID=588596 RepID=A0A2I1GR58_9GLOM|nr:hypothetical protein RhiirA4_464929 [Rhizophagus irregularis]